MSSEPTALPSGRLFKTDSTSVGIITRLEISNIYLSPTCSPPKAAAAVGSNAVLLLLFIYFC